MKRLNLTFSVLLASGVLALASTTSSVVPSTPPAGEILGTLRKAHPRLLATGDDFKGLKKRVHSDQQLGQWYDKSRADAEKILGEPASQYEIPDGLRLLGVSRRVLFRIQTLGMMYRLDGERCYAERAWKELEAAANFKDWNPRHFLDTAEMTHAFAIGYDWFYDAWTSEQRAVLREAILEKGLKLALGCYRGTARYGSWMKVRHNWNQVCNGGIGIGALAIADEAPELASEFLELALKSIQLPMARFAPDGAWDEGPGYWNYATTYNVALLAALETALGTDFGLSQMEGFSEAGAFPLFVTGPLGKTFNYADGGEGTIRAPHMFWLARKFQRPEYAAYQRQFASPHPLDLLWFHDVGKLVRRGELHEPVLRDLPPDKYFRDAEVVTFRSAWNDHNALFVGFKAGDNRANHSNLDLGTFVLDALGVRWAVDLGADNYNLPGYFGKQRWDYYRLRAEGHNTVVIDPGTMPDQDPAAATPITKFDSRPDRACAIADLTPAYKKHVGQVRRGIAFLDRKQVLVQDELESSTNACDFWWFMHTPADVELNNGNRTALLKQGDVRLRAQILSPSSAQFSVMPAQPLPSSPHPEKQRQNEGVRKLAVHLKDATKVRLAVLLTPLRANDSTPSRNPEVVALARW